MKAGHCHGGKAIAKLDIPGALQDAAGLLCGPVTNVQGSYCCIEPYVDSKYDILIQKIGSSYKAFMWVEFFHFGIFPQFKEIFLNLKLLFLWNLMSFTCDKDHQKMNLIINIYFYEL